MSQSNPSEKLSRAPLMGLAKLTKMAYAGEDIAPLGVEMIERAKADPGDANAFMDLATIMQLDFAPDLAADFLQQALQIQRNYTLAGEKGERLRVLTLMTPGNLMANAPLEFLVEDSDITLELFYIGVEEFLPEKLPEHDLVFVAINESDEVRPLLKRLAVSLRDWPRPVINRPEYIDHLGREAACDLLEGAAGMVMPRSVRVDAATLTQIGSESLSVDSILPGTGFPVLVRPVGSHAGQGLAKLDDASAIADYLQGREDEQFFVSPFIDYRNDDGLFRKYRLVLIAGRPYVAHMAISDHWMIHYANAGMADSAAKRAEEEHFMKVFDAEFARRHAKALAAIHARAGLDYLIIDCAETAQGELLVFELDSGAVIHAMDPVNLFPYKQPQMHKVFDAFRAMLYAAAEKAGVKA